ncbi:MAG: hypothetical protein ACI4DV_08250 [Lachnospiraceae bacterium]
MSIKENSVVKVVSDNPFFCGLTGTGKVTRLYGDMGTAIVRFESGQVAKIPVDLLKEIELKNENQEPKIPEGAKRITKDEFMKYLSDVITPDNIVDKFGPEKAMVVGMSVFIGGMKLLDRLYKESEVIVISRDQLIHEIAACAADEDPKFMIVALINCMILREIVDMIFSDGADNA